LSSVFEEDYVEVYCYFFNYCDFFSVSSYNDLSSNELNYPILYYSAMLFNISLLWIPKNALVASHPAYGNI